MAPRTLFDKIWDSHVVERLPDGTCILYIDRHLLHEVTSPQAFEGLRLRRPQIAPARSDDRCRRPQHSHRRPGTPSDIKEEDSRIQVQTLEDNVKAFGVPYIPILDVRPGIVHIIGPETWPQPAGNDDRLRRQPYLDTWCDGRSGVRHRHLRGRARDGDANPAAGAAEEHADRRVTGTLGLGCTAKDVVLAIIGKITTAGGNGHVIEYTGDAIRALDMAGHMTVSNMTIEGGARAGLIAPDQTTFDYVKGREYTPKGEAFEQAVAYWKTLPSDPGAHFDTEMFLTASRRGFARMVAWGTAPARSFR